MTRPTPIREASPGWFWGGAQRWAPGLVACLQAAAKKQKPCSNSLAGVTLSWKKKKKPISKKSSFWRGSKIKYNWFRLNQEVSLYVQNVAVTVNKCSEISIFLFFFRKKSFQNWINSFFYFRKLAHLNLFLLLNVMHDNVSTIKKESPVSNAWIPNMLKSKLKSKQIGYRTVIKWSPCTNGSNLKGL